MSGKLKRKKNMELHCIYHIHEAWRYDTKLLDRNMNPSWNANDLISINTEQQLKSLDINVSNDPSHTEIIED